MNICTTKREDNKLNNNRGYIPNNGFSEWGPSVIKTESDAIHFISDDGIGDLVPQEKIMDIYWFDRDEMKIYGYDEKPA